jgi:membrane-bound lytic murein transglycosylase F
MSRDKILPIAVSTGRRPSWPGGLVLLLVIVWAALSAACSEQRSVPEAAVGDEPVDIVADAADRIPEAASEDYEAVYVGDLDTLREQGVMRILIPANIGGVFYLPREGWPVEAQHEAAAAFARSQGLRPELVPVERFSDMIPYLADGRGDLIAANLTITDARRDRIAFSVPLTTVRQRVLVAAGEEAIHGVEDLAGRRVMADPSSSFWERLQRLREEHPTIELVARPPDMADEEELDAVASGRVDASIRDSNVADMYLSYRDDLRVAFELPGTDDIAWGVRRDANQLRAALNQFLHLEFAAQAEASNFKGDLQEIKQRRVLRVLLRNNAASYFLYRGELQGFEYELAKAFAKANRLRLEVIVPDSHAQMLQWLREGRGDVAAGFLEPDDDMQQQGIAYSRPYHHAPRHLVVREDDPLSGLQDLRGRTVTVRRSSPYWKDLQALRDEDHDFDLQAAPEDVETEELIEQVAAGDIDATVADGHLLAIELARGLAVRSGLQISDDRDHAVAVRAENPKLLAALNRFIKQEYKGLVYNVLYKKYFTSHRQVRDLAAGRSRAGGDAGLSPYDETTREYAERYGFDWRLVVAQMYQESRFDPEAESFAGAQGLMQVLPRTARFMGFEELKRPEDGIHAGIKYLDWVRNRFEPELPFHERMWFTLAAYNAGHGHVQDARRLARQKGWDGDRWFDNVEQAMLLLSKKQYARKARYGYVRGIEPVSYVRNIRQRYRAYVELSDSAVAQSATGTSGSTTDSDRVAMQGPEEGSQ